MSFFSLGLPPYRPATQIASFFPLFPGSFYCGGYCCHCHYCFSWYIAVATISEYVSYPPAIVAGIHPVTICKTLMW